MKTEEELCDFLSKDTNKIEKLCRICLSEDLCNAVLICNDSENESEDVESLESKLNMDRELSLWEKIAVFGRVKVKYEDDLLKYICEQCCYDVDVAYTFRVKCHKAENLLKKALEILARKYDDSEYHEVKKGILNTAFLAQINEACSTIKQECTDYTSDHVDDDYVPNDYSWVDKKVKRKLKKKKTKKQLKVAKNDNVEVKTETNQELITGIVNKYKRKQKDYVCKECQKQFASKASMISHMNRVHGKDTKNKIGIVTGHGDERRIQCPECDYKCKRWQAFHYHMSKHTGARPYQCDQCEKSFTQNGSLNIHKKVHSDTMHFTCQECGKQFKRRQVLLNHRRVHNTELNYKCHICSKGLKSPQTLDEHIKRHLQIKNYSCEVCGKCFVTRTEISSHLFTHNKIDKFKCTECSYATSFRSKFNLHIQRHTGIRPYKCDHCDYSGFTLGELNIHLIKHSKEPKYHCPVCDVKFRYSSSVNKHMLRKHGEASFKWNDTLDRRIVK